MRRMGRYGYSKIPINTHLTMKSIGVDMGKVKNPKYPKAYTLVYTSVIVV
jgi:hypothetical protein